MDISAHHAGDIGRILKSVQVRLVVCSLLLFGFLKILQDELVHLKSSLLDLGSGKDDKRMQRRGVCMLIDQNWVLFLTHHQSQKHY